MTRPCDAHLLRSFHASCMAALAAEFRALKLILEKEPEIGAKVRGSRNTRGLDYCGCMVYYSYESFFNAIYVFDIERADWSNPNAEIWKFFEYVQENPERFEAGLREHHEELLRVHRALSRR